MRVGVVEMVGVIDGVEVCVTVSVGVSVAGTKGVAEFVGEGVIVDSTVAVIVEVCVGRGPVGKVVRVGVAVRLSGARWITSMPAQ